MPQALRNLFPRESKDCEYEEPGDPAPKVVALNIHHHKHDEYLRSVASAFNTDNQKWYSPARK
eukprot:5400944-Amphidinium_carterae.1